MGFTQRTWVDLVDQVDAANFNEQESRIDNAVSSAVSAISNSQTALSGTVNLSGAGAVNVGSQTGNAFTISAPTQSVQTQSLVRAISASNSTFSGTVRVTGGPNVTVGTDASGLSISGADAPAQSVQTQNLVRAISMSDATKDQTVRITGAGNITVGSDASGAVVSGSQSVQPVGSAVPGGNTTGTTASLPFAGDVGVVGGNNLTVSQRSGTASTNLTLSVPNTSAQTVQTQSMVNAISASDATFSGTARITGAGDITVGSDASGAVVSGSQSAQTQSNVQGIIASDASYRTGDVVLTGSNAATVKSAAGQKAVIDVPTQTVQPGVQNLVASDNTFSSGTVSVTGTGGGVTVNTAASKIQVSVAAQSVQPGVQNLVASDNTFSSGTVSVTGAGEGITVNTAASKIQVSGAQTGPKHLVASDNTFSSGTVSVTGAGDITIGTAASKIIVSGSQSVQPVGSLAAAGNTAGTMGTLPLSGSVGLAGGSNVTVSQSSGTNSTNLTINAQSQSVQPVGSLSLSGNTAGTMANLPFASNMVLSAAGGATLSQSSGASSSIVQLSVHTSQSVQPGLQNLVASDNTFSSGTASLTGAGEGITVNTAASKIQISGAQTGPKHLVASDATFSSGTVSVTGVNNITVNTAASKIQISAPNTSAQTVQPGVAHLVASDNTFSSGTASVTGVGEGITVNTAASKIQLSGSQTGVKHLVASDNTFSSGTVSVSGAGQGITVNTAAGKIQVSGAYPNLHVWQNQEDQGLSVLSHLSVISKTPYYFPATVAGNLTPNSIGVRLLGTGTATLQSFSIHFGLYTYVNSTSAALLASGSDSYNDSVASSASWSAGRDWVLTSPGTVAALSRITPGGYVMGLMFSAAATQSMNMSLIGGSNATSIAPQGVVLPGNNQMSSGTTQGLNGFYGPGSTTVNAMPANVVAADIRQQATATQPGLPYMFIRS